MSMLRGQRLGFAIRRTARVDWSNCLTNQSPKALRDNFARLDSALSQNRIAISNCAADVPAIDWDSFAAKGVPAETIASLRTKYEALTFPEPQPSANGEHVDAFISAYAARIAPVTEGSQGLLTDLNNLKAKLQEDFITMKDWETEDWARRFPGIVDKVRARHLVGDLTEDEHTTKYMALDNKQITADVQAGKTVDLEMPADVDEYYFGGLNMEGDFPNTPPELLAQLNERTADGVSAEEAINDSFVNNYGDLWNDLFSKISPSRA
jgi:hypothetical protein